jgi:hypothetical protein
MDNSDSSVKATTDKTIVPVSGDSFINPTEIGANFIVGVSPDQNDSLSESELVDQDELRQALRDRINYVKNQPLVVALSEGDQVKAMDTLLHEIGEEISHLKWERRKAAKEGKNTAQFTVARITSLKSLAETLIRRKEAAMAENLDLKSPRLQKIFRVWMKFFYEAMEKSEVPSEVINVVFQQMKADMAGWESRMSDS